MTQQPLSALRTQGSLEFIGNDNPKCPHCGSDYNISANDAWSLYEEGEHEVECPSCDLAFIVSTHVRYSFWTDSQEDECWADAEDEQ